VAVLPPGDVLDAGCGAGTGTRVLAQRSDLRVTAVDPSGALLDALDRRGLHDVRQADLEQLPFDDGAFRGVVCSEALATADDAALVLEELVRVLHPEGVLVAQVPGRDQSKLVGHIGNHFAHLVTARLCELLGAGVLADDGPTEAEVHIEDALDDVASVVVASNTGPARTVAVTAFAAPGTLDAWRGYDRWRNESLQRMAAAAARLEHERARRAEAQRLLLRAEQTAALARALEAECTELHRRIEDLNHQLALIHGSFTWRATQPVRNVAAKGKRFARSRFEEITPDAARRRRDP
jgi:SAM-dependent methyltransferase